MTRRILVVGGVAAGASAATKARRTDEHAEIIMFERGPHVSFANCGLPYYVGREIKSRDSLLVVTPKRFKERHNIDVRVHHEVVGISPQERTITVRDLRAETTYVEPYDALVLAPGARAIVPRLPMVDGSNVFLMRTIPDMDRVEAFIERHQPRQATIVGAGFIGIEMAEALMARGIRVSMVEKLDQVLPPLDPDMAAPVGAHMRDSGVDLVLGDGVKAFEGKSSDGEKTVGRVVLESGRVISTDFVILSIGVRPDVALARDAGLTIGATGAIAVDARMQTSDPHIWAAGDAVESVHLVTGKPVWIALAGPANKQGRVAGCNAAGGNLRFSGVLGTSIVRFDRVTAATTGLNERAARQAGYDAEVAVVHGAHHAAYYPGAQALQIKLVYERHGGRLLGAQVVGEAGVDKRIDVLATALTGNLTVDDLTELDLAYAPPFGAARDPAIVAGFVAQNQISGGVKTVTADQLHDLLTGEEDVQLIDVRTRGEFAEGLIPGARLIPLDELRSRIDEVDKGRPAVIYCRVGVRAYLACRILTQHGYDAMNLSGGITSWRFEKEHARQGRPEVRSVEEASLA